jgi:transcriptional regulator with XRE-family HTH domain
MAERHELGGVLRGWRERLAPSAVGLCETGGQRRSPGLRREELASLASISPDYIKRLEQGRARPSAAVLDSLARALPCRFSNTSRGAASSSAEFGALITTPSW